MKKRCVMLAVLLAIAWTPMTVAADPRFSGRGGDGRLGPRTTPHALGPGHTHGPFVHNRFSRHRFAPHRFVPFGVIYDSPVVVYSPPPVVYAPPVFQSVAVYNSAAVYSPASIPAPAGYGPSAYGQPLPVPSTPRIVEFPTGRYELRGDGIATPYTWVWIPNPPSAPPASAATSADAAPASRTQVYRWVDEQGVVHWTNRAETIPRRYREAS